MSDEKAEKSIDDLNYPEAPKMITEFPGPRSKAVFEKGLALESP